MLKLAVGRLQTEMDAKDKVIADAGLADGQTFVTQGKQPALKVADEEMAAHMVSTDSVQPIAVAQQSVLDSQLNADTIAGTSLFDSKIVASTIKRDRAQTRSPASRYK